MKIRSIIFYIVVFGIIVILNSLLVLYSPFAFVRVVNLILIIIDSVIIGSFLREIFIIQNKADQKIN